jgi:hypothetical protein
MITLVSDRSRELIRRDGWAGWVLWCPQATETIAWILNPIMFSCIAYWMIGFQPDPVKFILFTIFMVLCYFSATSMAAM